MFAFQGLRVQDSWSRFRFEVLRFGLVVAFQPSRWKVQLSRLRGSRLKVLLPSSNCAGMVYLQAVFN